MTLKLTDRFHHRPVHLFDKTIRLKKRNKFPWRNQASILLFPSYQRLCSTDTSIFDPYLRLEPRDKFFSLQRRIHLILIYFFHQLPVSEGLIAEAERRLMSVFQCLVRLHRTAADPFHLDTVDRVSLFLSDLIYTDRCLEMDISHILREFFQTLLHLLQALQQFLILPVQPQHGKPVRNAMSHQLVFPAVFPQRLLQPADRLIPRLHAEQFVDQLKMVDIHRQHCRLAFFLFSQSFDRRQHKAGIVHSSGHRIHVGIIFQPFILLLLLSDDQRCRQKENHAYQDIHPSGTVHDRSITLVRRFHRHNGYKKPVIDPQRTIICIFLSIGITGDRSFSALQQIPSHFFCFPQILFVVLFQTFHNILVVSVFCHHNFPAGIHHVRIASALK